MACALPTPTTDEPLDELDVILSQTSSEELRSILDSESAFSDTDPAFSDTDPAFSLATPTCFNPAPPSERFAAPKTEEEVKTARENAIPKNTRSSTTWAVNVWKEWTVNLHQQLPSFQCPPHIMLCSPPQLSYWLSRFVLEVRRQNGEHHPPQTLYSMCCGLLRYVREVKPEINIFKDPQYADFQRTLDAEMKRLRSTGLGVKPK